MKIENFKKAKRLIKEIKEKHPELRCELEEIKRILKTGLTYKQTRGI